MENNGSSYLTLNWGKKSLFSDKYLFHDGSKGIASVQFNSLSFKYKNALISFTDEPEVSLKSRGTFKTSIDIIRDGTTIGTFSQSSMNSYKLEIEGDSYMLKKKTWVSEWTWLNDRNEKAMFINKNHFGEKGTVTLKGDLNGRKSLLATLAIYAISIQEKETMVLLFAVFLPIFLNAIS